MTSGQIFVRVIKPSVNFVMHTVFYVFSFFTTEYTENKNTEITEKCFYSLLLASRKESPRIILFE